MIDKLEYVIALARERHFGRAAAACGVAQPTLSAGLKQLEDTLGVLIVQRSARFQGLTPEGERVLTWARRMVGDARALRQELQALRKGLAGHLRIAAIPTALPMVAAVTTPYRERHPEVRFSILSRTSVEVLRLLGDAEIDAGITYLDNEPLGHVQTVPLYRERYRLLTTAGGAFGGAEQVSWADVGTVPLCLLTPDMQNRRIIDQVFRSVGLGSSPTLQSDSMIVLFSHVRTGRWSSVVPAILADAVGLPASIRSLPIVDPDVSHEVGLVVAARDPATPLVDALVAEARRLAEHPAAAAD
jgi:DNA-binding transcriptional LysR family regulator